MSNVIIITGNLGRDPERQHEGSGPVILSVADSVGFGERKTTTWRRVAVWGKTAEYCLGALAKGDMVTVTGEESQRTWTDKDGRERVSSEVNARSVDGPFKRVSRDERAGERRGGYSQGADRSAGGYGGGSGYGGGYGGGGAADDDDSLPF